ncbi:alpha-(1,3)-fucosyltransferase C-like [Epargyreus clarus]|uniref:alpha-(1,3)-fucosyltransferase C-like n=1 Tax=Epargyreus clarus TaxID=520877 RepID=UPI003C2ECEAE
MYRIASTHSFNQKAFCAIIILLLSIIFFFLNTYNRYSFGPIHEMSRINHEGKEDNGEKAIMQFERYSDMKYILLWTNPKNFPFVYFGEGQQVFIQKKCKWTNCYVTGDRGLLGDYSEFDVIAFNGPQLGAALATTPADLPARRTPAQKYVYANIESANTYPVCNRIWNDYFNWTWTYKLDSDSLWRYFVVRDERGNIIGPATSVHWISVAAMKPVDDDLLEKLSGKRKAAAWFVSNCNTESRREEFASQVQNYLRRYDLKVDVFGECGTLQCPKQIMSRCLNMLERDYYFYFAFENALSEDYVTEKILYALKHYTVPIVYGGANYSRFMPPGAYLDGRRLGAAGLAERMYELTQSPPQYQKMFRWRQHYSFHYTHARPDADVYCGFCAALNAPEALTTTVYERFDAWWTPKDACRGRDAKP